MSAANNNSGAAPAPSADWVAVGGLIAAMVIWSSSFVALKIAFRSYAPLAVIFGRMAIAALCFLVIFRPFRRICYRPGDWKLLLLMAFCEPCLYFLFEAGALCHTSASQAGMVVAMLPLLVAVAARIVLKEYLSRRTIMGFFLAIFGVIWLTSGAEAEEAAPNPALGNFLEFVAMACATGYIVILKYLSHRYSPLFLTAVQALVGALFYLPIMLAFADPLPWYFEIQGLSAVAFLGIVVSIGAYGLYNFGVSRIPASQATAFTNLIPVFTVFMGWLFLGERFTTIQYLASALVLTGVFLSQDPPRRSKATG